MHEVRVLVALIGAIKEILLAKCRKEKNFVKLVIKTGGLKCFRNGLINLIRLVFSVIHQQIKKINFNLIFIQVGFWRFRFWFSADGISGGN